MLRRWGVDACLAPRVATFRRLAEASVSSRLDSPAILPRTASRWLVRQAISAAETAGELDILASSAWRTGLVDAVEEMIGQWKSRGVSAEEFGELARRRGGNVRNVELAAIYLRYQQMLAQRDAADRFDVARLGVAALRKDLAEGKERLELVVIDALPSYSRWDQAMSQVLLDHAPQGMVTLMCDASGERSDRGGREELFASAAETLEWLEGRYKSLQVEEVLPPPPREDLAYLRERLYLPPDTEGRATRVAEGSGISVVAAADSADEAVQVARRVKRLLVDQQVAPHDVAIAVASLAGERHRWREVLTSYGIPFWIDTPVRVGEVPEFAAVMMLLGMHVEGWPYRAVLEVVGNRHIRYLDTLTDHPRWPRARGGLEWMVRELQVAQGQGELVEQVARIALGAAESEESLTQRQRGARVAARYLTTLSEALDELPPKGTALEWAAATGRLAVRVGLRLDDSPGGSWRRVREAAATVDRAGQTGGEPKVWSLTEWLGQLRDWGDWLPAPDRTAREGGVAVVSLEAARHLAPRHLFVVGLGEQALANVGSSRGLMSDEEYDALAATLEEGRGYAPPSYLRGMQLFYELVSSSQDSLTLSFPSLDAKGQPMPPSSLLEEACAVLGPAWTAQLHTQPRLSVLPSQEEKVCSHKEWRLAGVAELLERKPRSLAALLRHRATARCGESLMAALEAIHHRASGDSFGRWEGLVTGSGARELLVRRFGPDHVWSPSQLEAYAACPYKFLLSQVLGIEPLADLELATDHRQLGSLLHDALKRMHEELRNVLPEGHAVTATEQAVFEAAFATAIDRALENVASFGLEGVLNELLASQVRKWKSAYRQQHEQYDAGCAEWESPLVPRHFELRFGPASRRAAAEEEDPLSTDSPFLLELDGETIQMGGRIDRIDVGRVAGQVVFQVVDYKTAAKHPVSPDEVADGRKLQPALYAMAAAQIVSTERNTALPLAAGYWVVRQKGFDEKTSIRMHLVEENRVVVSPTWEELQPRLTARLRELIDGIRRGEFPMQNPDEDCTARCDFGHICRVQQCRSLGKVWPASVADEAPAAATSQEQSTK